MAHRKMKRYTNEEKQIIRDYVAQYPTNLAIAFEQAASHMKGRTAAGVSAFFYGTLRKESGTPMMAMATTHGIVTNVKQVSRPAHMRKGLLSAFDVAITAVDELTIEEKKALIRYMMKNY